MFWITHFSNYLSRCGVMFINQKSDRNFKYCWWKKKFNEVVIYAALEKKWVKNLPNLQLGLTKLTINVKILICQSILIVNCLLKSHRKIYGTGKPLRF